MFQNCSKSIEHRWIQNRGGFRIGTVAKKKNFESLASGCTEFETSDFRLFDIFRLLVTYCRRAISVHCTTEFAVQRSKMDDFGLMLEVISKLSPRILKHNMSTS